MSEYAACWRGAPREPPETRPHLKTEIDDGQLRLVEGEDGWVAAEAVVALDDMR